jgi:hypothetical protein
MNKLLVVLVLFSLCCIPALAADTPKAEVYGGYQLLRHPGGDGYDAYKLNGFLASVEGNVKPFLGIVGEFGYVRKSWDYGEGYSETENFSTFLFGPRFGVRAGKVRVFAHYLLGGIRYSDSYGGTDYNETHFAQAIGGGLDITLNKMISIRPAQMDLVSIKWTDSWEKAFRYSGGIVFKFGGK